MAINYITPRGHLLDFAYKVLISKEIKVKKPLSKESINDAVNDYMEEIPKNPEDEINLIAAENRNRLKTFIELEYSYVFKHTRKRNIVRTRQSLIYLVCKHNNIFG